MSGVWDVTELELVAAYGLLPRQWDYLDGYERSSISDPARGPVLNTAPLGYENGSPGEVPGEPEPELEEAEPELHTDHSRKAQAREQAFGSRSGATEPIPYRRAGRRRTESR